MKKTIKLLIFTLIMSFGFITGLKAVSCQYEDSVTRTKYTFEVGERSGNFTLTYKGHLLSEYNANDTNSNVFKDGEYYIFTGGGTDSMTMTFTNVSSDGCPTTVYMEEKKNVKINKYDYTNFGLGKNTDGKVNMRLFYTYATGQYTILKRIVKSTTEIKDENGNSQIIEQDVNAICNAKSGGKKYTAYEFEKGKIAVTGGSKNIQDNALNLTLCAFSDGTLGIALGSEESTFKILEDNYSEDCDMDCVAWEQYGNSTGYKTLKLLTDQVNGLKSNFRYVEGKSVIKSSDVKICYVKNYKKGLITKEEFLIGTGSDCDKLEEFTGNSAVDATTDWDASKDRDWNRTSKGGISKSIGTCVDYLGDSEDDGTLAHYLQIIYTIIKVVAIILTIVMSMIDFASAINKNRDELMATAMKWVKRLIIVIIVLLMPTLIDVFGNILGQENILCGIK